MKISELNYQRLNMEQVTHDFTMLIENVKSCKNPDEIIAIHKQYYKIYSETMDTIVLANIRHDADVTDAFYDGENSYYDTVYPEVIGLINEYNKAIYESPYRSALEQMIGKVAIASMENQMRSMDDSILSYMQEENRLKSEYNKLIASARIMFDGEEKNLSLMRPYLISNDREVRKAAWKAYSAYFQSIEAKLDELYDALVKNRTLQARTLGYDNFVELGYYRMNRNSYGKAEIENFRKQVKEVFVPLAEKVHERRRMRLGLDKLSYIDNEVYFKGGNPAPVGSPEEILQTGQKMYREMSKETAEFFDFMMEHELFDVFGRKNKKQGGYMTYLNGPGFPFIFANFNQTAGDIDVITHECGHAFQGYLSGKNPIMEHRDITMETAEIHSMSMEFFSDPWMEQFFGDTANDFLTMQLEDAIAFIPYGTMVDEFQHIIYENPDYTIEQRKEVWKSLEKCYKPHLNYEDDPYFGNGGFWQKQQHIYNSPFYYIDYVLAQTCAFQFKIMMDENYEDAWKRYLALCELSASEFYGDMLRKVGLKVPFENGYFEDMIEKLSQKLTDL